MSYDVTSLYLTVRDLRPYTTYGVLLRAHTSVGAGPSSDLYTVQTHEEGMYTVHNGVVAIGWAQYLRYRTSNNPYKDTINCGYFIWRI